MKSSHPLHAKRIAALALGISWWAMPLPGIGATDLADTPLANTPAATILPNIMFILDDSGSMDRNYMPDYITGSYCRGTGTSLDNCSEGMPPFYASAFNRVYYNPLINYTPPLDASNNPKTSYTTWTDVPKDGYGIQSTSKTNLTTSYPEKVACKNSGDDVYSANCKSLLDASNNYSYPDATYDNIKTKYGAPFYYTVKVEWCKNQATSGPKFGKSGTCQARKDATYKYVRYYDWQRVDIIPSVTSYTGPNSTTRSYSDEMTNFANWYAWYRTRMQMMKTGVGQAFADMRGTPNTTDAADKNYFHARVGFTTISEKGVTDGSKYLAIGNFDSGQKSTFFTRLYASDPSSYTPLRGALMKAGRIYAGKVGGDPIQYSCQRNFTILSTDGYWNTDEETSSYGPYKEDASTLVGDQDGNAPVPSYDKLKKENTLADVAYYYYHTDLRPGTCTKCTNNVPPAGTKANEDDVASHQHMTTYTIGLGVDGNLVFEDNYRSSNTGDYAAIMQGTKNWPNPLDAEDEDRIDDLWHAAVNGRGTYFSARDPDSLVKGLKTALGAMESKSGSGAAAATSNLEPTLGDNFMYIANYRTVKWDGELSAHTIDVGSGSIATSPTWQAGTTLEAKIAGDGNSDTRTIYTSSGSALKPFLWTNLTTAERAYFDNTKLSQYAEWSADQKAAATGEKMVNYLRGQHRHEDQTRPDGFGTYYRLYRDRERTLGDIVHSQPVYVQKTHYQFTDPGYDAFKSSVESRPGTVYVAANDGMLHAFDSTTGQERWAYLVPMAMPELWRLADNDYSTNHRFFVDGPLSVSDVKIGSSWRTILVGGMGKGGRGYYALDITDPTSPSLLWTFSANDDPNVGYSYGVPIITKVNGNWSVLVTSGHNNVPEGTKYTSANGKGYLFVLDAATGTVTQTISTNSGSVANPSGLARINVKVDAFLSDNSSVMAYGGDLNGDMWRFDFASGTASKVIALGSNQPITAAPEIAVIKEHTVLMFGTGKYLGQADLTNNNTQAIYAVKDKVTEATSTSELISAGSSTAIDWDTGGGWYYTLPETGERVYLEAQLYVGTLIVASVIPEATECSPGGYSKMYFFNAVDGTAIGTSGLSVTFTSPVVGITVVKLTGGVRVYGVTADGAIPSATSMPIYEGSPPGENPPLPGESGRRIIWRELLVN